MKKKIIGLLFLLMCVGCTNKPTCNIDPKVLKTNDSIIALVKSKKWFSRFLVSLKEPELESFKEEEVYRFLILDSFGDYDSYRINKIGDSYFITSKHFWKNKEDTLKHEEIKVDSLSKEQKTKISTQNWMTIKNSLDEMNFWSLSTKEKDKEYSDVAYYAIEGYTSKKNECTNRNYHLTGRATPEDSTLYKSLFKKVIKLAENQKHN